MKRIVYECCNGKTVTADISPNNISIHDSYKITSREDMDNILQYIRYCTEISEYPVIKYTNNKQLIREWCTHNLLYDFGILKERTKTVDLDYPQKWYFKLGYFIGSLLYW